MPARSSGHDFDRLAPYYDRALRVLFSFLWGEGKLRRRMASLIGDRLPPGSRVLEVACGTGSNLKALDEAYPARHTLAGIDLSLPMLRQARGKPFLSERIFVHADAAALPFPDATFDAVLCVWALHEMPGLAREKALSEMARVLRRGGSALIVDFARPANPVGRALFSLVVLIEDREAMAFVRRMSRELRALLPLRWERTEKLLLGFTEMALFRKDG